MAEPKVDEIVDKYIALRDLKAQKKAAYDASVADIDTALAKCESYLLAKMQEQGVESYKTAAGTAYVQTRTGATVADWDGFLGFVRDQQAWHMLERRVSKTAVDEFRAANDDLPPGINYRVEKVVNIRRS